MSAEAGVQIVGRIVGCLFQPLYGPLDFDQNTVLGRGNFVSLNLDRDTVSSKDGFFLRNSGVSRAANQ